MKGAEDGEGNMSKSPAENRALQRRREKKGSVIRVELSRPSPCVIGASYWLGGLIVDIYYLKRPGWRLVRRVAERFLKELGGS